jgi:import inner membrane translocase subunit TIM9
MQFPQLDKLTPLEQQRVQNATQYKEVQSQIKSFEGMLNNCFSVCIEDFTTNSLSKQETNCARKCHEKYLDFLQRTQLLMTDIHMREKLMQEQ